MIETEADNEFILRRLEPFENELKNIGHELEELNPDELLFSEMAAAYRAAEMQYLFYLGKE